MMTEIKRGLKLMRYGYGVKQCLVGGILIYLSGILVCCIADDSFIMVGILYMMLGPIMLVQVMYSLLYSGFVGASPRRRGIEILIADGINIITGLMGYLLLMIVAVVRVNNAPEQAQDIMEWIVLGSMGITAVFICFGACYKYYWQSMVLFFIVFFAVYGGGMVFLNLMQITFHMAWTAGISLVLISAGVFLSCVMRRLVYRKSMSPSACGTGLRKAMQ